MISEVHNIDCMEFMRGLPDKFFDLAVVDPPYGININFNMGRRKNQEKKHTEKKWDNAIYFKDGCNRFEQHRTKVEEVKSFGYAKTELEKINKTLF